MRYYKLYAGLSATTTNAANLQIVKAGRIRTVAWAVRVDSVTDNAALDIELSNQITSVIGANDTRGPIDQICWCGNFVTSGLAQGAVNEQRILDFPVAQGERLYINTVIAGTLAAAATIIIGVEE